MQAPLIEPKRISKIRFPLTFSLINRNKINIPIALPIPKAIIGISAINFRDCDLNESYTVTYPVISLKVYFPVYVTR